MIERQYAHPGYRRVGVRRCALALRLPRRDWVAWRDGAGIRAAPDRCPHRGTRLIDRAGLRRRAFECAVPRLALRRRWTVHGDPGAARHRAAGVVSARDRALAEPGTAVAAARRRSTVAATALAPGPTPGCATLSVGPDVATSAPRIVLPRPGALRPSSTVRLGDRRHTAVGAYRIEDPARLRRHRAAAPGSRAIPSRRQAGAAVDTAMNCWHRSRRGCAKVASATTDLLRRRIALFVCRSGRADRVSGRPRVERRPTGYGNENSRSSGAVTLRQLPLGRRSASARRPFQRFYRRFLVERGIGFKREPPGRGAAAAAQCRR